MTAGVPRFAAPEGRGLRALSWAVTAVTLVLPLGALVLVDPELGEAGAAGHAARAALLAVALVGPACWAFAPRAFAVEGGALRVERPLWPVAVPLAELREVRVLPEGALRGALRTCGVAGAFGWYGWYWSRALGSFLLYARRRSGPFVLAATARRRLVLAPSDAEALAAALRARAHHVAPAVEGGWPPAGRASARAPVLFVAGVLAVPLLLVAGVLGASWGYAPVAIGVEDGAVVVARRWVGPVTIPLDRVSRAEPVPPAWLRGLRRVGGVALGEVAYGAFRSDGLGRFRLYAHRRGPMVLLQTDDGPVVVTPDQPATFLEAVQRGHH